MCDVRACVTIIKNIIMHNKYITTFIYPAGVENKMIGCFCLNCQLSPINCPLI